MPIDFTVAIPTYNSEDRLHKIIDRLQAQVGVDHLSWEIIVVDNNSSDNTAKVIDDYKFNWSQSYPLKYYFEAEQGAAFARQRAVIEAKGILIFFFDDDNLPDFNWLAAAYLFGQEHPKAGAYAGQIHGDFEVTPPENFEQIQHFLAIRTYGEKPYLFEPENLRLPPAAALAIRKQAWCEAVSQNPIFKGRLGNSLVGGEDLEPLLYLHKAGWEIWYTPNLHTYHQIPHWRLERKYLLNLARSCGLPTCTLLMINAKNWQKPMIFLRTILGNLRRVILHIIKYRQQIKTNLIAAFQMEFFLGSLVSPFYFLKVSFKRKKES